MKYSWSKSIGRFRLWIAGEGDERHWYPQLGRHRLKPTGWPGVFAEDGELSIYAAWWIVEVKVVLKRYPAKCVRGVVGKREWWDKTL